MGKRSLFSKLPRAAAALVVSAAAGCGCATALLEGPPRVPPLEEEGPGQPQPPQPQPPRSTSTVGVTANKAGKDGPGASTSPQRPPTLQQPQPQQPQQPQQPPTQLQQPQLPPSQRLRRRYSTQGDWTAEWTPEGGGNASILRRQGTMARKPTDDGAMGMGADAPHPRLRRPPSSARRAATTAAGGGEDDGSNEGRGQVLSADEVLRRLQAWETQPPGPCDKYNSITTRFLGWETRRRECNAMPGCVFVGRSVTGFCVGEDDWEGRAVGDEEEDDDYDELLNDHEFPSPSDPEGAMVETELLASLVTVIREEGIEQPVRLLITGSLADAMTDSLKQGQSGSKELAKELVMEMLSEPETPQVLKHVLGNAQVRASVRRRLGALLQVPATQEQTQALLQAQLDWLLVRNRWTEQSLAATFNWLLRAPMTHDALAPLLRWTLSAEGPVLDPAVKLTRSLVPSLEESAVVGLKASVRYALESEYVRTLAKESVRDAILGKITALQEAQRKRDEELRRRMRRREQGLPEEEGGPKEGAGAAAAVAEPADGAAAEEEREQPPDDPRPPQGVDTEGAASEATQAAMEELRRARQTAFDKAEEH